MCLILIYLHAFACVLITRINYCFDSRILKTSTFTKPLLKQRFQPSGLFGSNTSRPRDPQKRRHCLMEPSLNIPRISDDFGALGAPWRHMETPIRWSCGRAMCGTGSVASPLDIYQKKVPLPNRLGDPHLANGHTRFLYGEISYF